MQQHTVFLNSPLAAYRAGQALKNSWCFHLRAQKNQANSGLALCVVQLHPLALNWKRASAIALGLDSLLIKVSPALLGVVNGSVSF